MSNNQETIPAESIFDVRDIPCAIKHGQILDRWRSLSVGAFFVLKNDHDPVPLRYQFEAQFPGYFTWEHLEKGPTVYQVKIQKLKQIPEVITETATCCGGR